MTIRVAEQSLDPPVFLAPMAGITDLPFRRLVGRFGAGLLVSEMVASREVVTKRPGTRERAELGLEDTATAVQLAGREPAWMAEAARIVEAMGARIIDINMGCPAKKVTGGLSGAALMRDLDHAVELIEAVVGAVSVPVTLKCRLGWDADRLVAPELGRRARDAGIRLLTVHGRTRCQFYRGVADWGAIAPVVRSLDIPVIANGDVTDATSAETAIRRSGAAGVMVGRAARGAPWAVAEIAAGLSGAPRPRIPEGAARADLVRDHHEAMLSFYGRDLGLRVARKHLGWYMDRSGTPGPLRREVLTATSAAAVHRRLPAAIGQTSRAAA